MRTRGGWPALLCVLTGCSTSPLVDTLDFFKPGRQYPTRTPYGGVCIPQGPGVLATTPSAPLPPPIPPPLPLPPSGPPISVPTLPAPPGSVNPVPNAPAPAFPTAP